MASHKRAVTTVDEETHRTDLNAACPECEGRLQTESGETACTDCGLVIEACRIDPGPEWREFNDGGESRERTGAPRTHARHDRGLSTDIGRNTDGKGRALSRRKRRQLSRLRREHGRARYESRQERNQAYAFTEIRRLISGLGLGNSLRDQACALFDQAQEARLLQGRSLEGFAAGSVYAVCRCNRRPETIATVAEHARCEKREIQNAYSVLNRELGLPTPPPRPAAFVPKLVSELGLSEEIRRQARAFATEGTEAGLVSGRNPAGYAAACIAVAADRTGETVAQNALAEAADVCPVTVRKGEEKVAEGAIDG